jgi:Xaa-Pro aminopeptidase
VPRVARSDRLDAALAATDLDALLVTHLTNLRYLTGFTGSNGLAVAGPSLRVFVSDFRYVTQAADEVDGWDFHRGSRELLDSVEPVLPEGRIRLGFEDAHLSVRRHAALRELLPERVELVAAGEVIEGMRRVKDPDERDRIAAAARLADDALDDLLADGLVGRCEREVALTLETGMRRRGAEAPSFPSIVASGPHGARPHAAPRSHDIEPDALVVIDWGARLDGYCSDGTRTVATGEGIGDDAREVYELVRRAQAAALERVAAGREARAVDGAARDLIDAAGHGEEFGHPLGHGVGLDVHEAPRLGAQNEAPLVAGEVVTVEPGVYLPDRFGVRIEDLVAVTDEGADVFSSLPKELTVVD